jgi:hypothetical protein
MATADIPITTAAHNDAIRSFFMMYYPPYKYLNKDVGLRVQPLVLPLLSRNPPIPESTFYRQAVLD